MLCGCLESFVMEIVPLIFTLLAAVCMVVFYGPTDFTFTTQDKAQYQRQCIVT